MCNCNKILYVFYLCVYVTFCIFDKKLLDVTKKNLTFSLCSDYLFLLFFKYEEKLEKLCAKINIPSFNSIKLFKKLTK